MIDANKLIENKRKKQISKGYTSSHDDAHVNGEIVYEYAMKYILRHRENCYRVNNSTGQDRTHFINNAIDDLSEVGACVVAEIERLQRLK